MMITTCLIGFDVGAAPTRRWGTTDALVVCENEPLHPAVSVTKRAAVNRFIMINTPRTGRALFFGRSSLPQASCFLLDAPAIFANGRAKLCTRRCAERRNATVENTILTLLLRTI